MTEYANAWYKKEESEDAAIEHLFKTNQKRSKFRIGQIIRFETAGLFFGKLGVVCSYWYGDLELLGQSRFTYQIMLTDWPSNISAQDSDLSIPPDAATVPLPSILLRLGDFFVDREDDRFTLNEKTRLQFPYA